MTLLGLVLETCRSLRRQAVRPAALREPAACDVDPEIPRRLSISAIARGLADELQAYPASWHNDVLTELGYLLHLDGQSDNATLERMLRQESSE